MAGWSRSIQDPVNPGRELGSAQTQVLRAEGEILGHQRHHDLFFGVLEDEPHLAPDPLCVLCGRQLAHWTEPRVGSSKPLRRRTRVDLPEPLSPITAMR